MQSATACRLGSFSPRKPHDYDAEFPTWENAAAPAPNPLCGGTVSGAYIESPSNGTDYLTDDKYDFLQNEVRYSIEQIRFLSWLPLP